MYPRARGAPTGAPAGWLRYDMVSPEFFAVLDLPLIRGRLFTGDEARSRTPVALVSMATARQWWPGEDPIGKRIVLERDDLQRNHLARFDGAVVIGVVGNVRPGWIGLPMDLPVVYYPQLATAPGATVLARTR